MNEKDFIKIDIENIEPVELFDWEKKNIEKSIFHSSKRHSNKKIKWLSAIATITLIFTGSVIWIPAVADRLPIVQQLLQLNNNPQLQVFNDNATIINQIDESNGSSIDLAEAFFDGNIVSISYEMKHEEPIDEAPLSWNGQLELNGIPLDTLSHQIIKKNDYTWIGMFTARVSDEAIHSTINLQWSPKVFKGIENTTLAEGEWSYQLELTPTQAYSKKVNIPFGDEQYQLLFNQLSVGKYMTTLYFEGNLDNYTEFLMVDIKDDLGNVYENVGVTTSKNEFGQTIGYVEVFIPDINVQTLIITPSIRIVDEKTLKRKELIPLSSVKIPFE